MPSLVDGNKKRPPTEYVAKLISGSMPVAKVHPIERDASELYKVVLDGSGHLYVYDINGVAKTVTFPDGNAYIDGIYQPRSQFRLLTIADYTFVVNTTVKVQMKTTLTAARGNEGLIFVKQAQNALDYTATVNGSPFTFHTASSLTTTTGVAGSVSAAITTAGVTKTQFGPVIWLQSASALTVQGFGPNGESDMRAFTKSIQNFSDLPTIAPTDYHVEVSGDQSNTFDNYYVKFVPQNAGSTFDSGYWKETIAEGVKYQLDPDTMPHVLIRNSDGTFTFKKATWADRVVGDDNTNPVPSFIGETINDVVFHKDRLGFLADSNAVLSETGEFFNFFRTTVTALLDTDPIDVSVNQVAILRSGVAFDKELLLFSDKHEFTLSGGDVLTPKTATTDEVTKFETVGSTLPVASDKAVYFAFPKPQFGGVREFYIDPVSGRPTALDITAHVPKYISGDVTELAICPNENIMAALSAGDASTVWAYNFFWNGDQKLQSAWGAWTFNGATVLSCSFLKSVLYLVLQRADGVYLVKLDVSSARSDSSDVTHLTNLDMRVLDTQCPSKSYNATTKRTTFTLPYPVNTAATYQIVSTGTGGIPAGVVMQNVTATGSTVSCDGDQTGYGVYIGEQYRQSFTLSQQFVTFKKPSGEEVVVPDATLKLLYATFVFEKTGYFKVQVDYNHRPGSPQITEYTGRTVGSPINETDHVALEDGKLRVRVGADAARCTITVFNDSFLPCNMQSVSWEGRENLRTQQGA